MFFRWGVLTLTFRCVCVCQYARGIRVRRVEYSDKPMCTWDTAAPGVEKIRVIFYNQSEGTGGVNRGHLIKSMHSRESTVIDSDPIEEHTSKQYNKANAMKRYKQTLKRRYYNT